jgi:hypothetical protein
MPDSCGRQRDVSHTLPDSQIQSPLRFTGGWGWTRIHARPNAKCHET